MARRYFVLVAVVCVALAACTARAGMQMESAGPPEGALTAPPPDASYVYLEHKSATPEQDCIGVYGDPAYIWLTSPPSRVEWQVLKKDPKTQWVIEFDGSKNPKGSGLFPGGKFVIGCGTASAFRSPLPTAEGTWTYKVSVYECANGAPKDNPVCVRDPEVIIWK